MSAFFLLLAEKSRILFFSPKLLTKVFNNRQYLQKHAKEIQFSYDVAKQIDCYDVLFLPFLWYEAAKDNESNENKFFWALIILSKNHALLGSKKYKTTNVHHLHFFASNDTRAEFSSAQKRLMK